MKHRFKAVIRIDGKQKNLGTYDMAKEAALAYDRAVVQHKRPRSLLNYPDGLPIDDEDYDALMNPKKKRKLSSRNTTGYTGVYKIRERFRASICVGNRKTEQIGTYDPFPNPPEIKLDEEKVTQWIGKGAQPSESVTALLQTAGILPKVETPSG